MNSLQEIIHAAPVPTAPAVWLERLLEAATPAAVARVVVETAEAAPGCTSATMIWWPAQAVVAEAQPPPALDAAEQELVERARHSDTLQRGESGCAAWRVHRNDGVVLLVRLAAGADPTLLQGRLMPLLQLAGRQLQRVGELQHLQHSHGELQRSGALQRALFAIADLAGADLVMAQMMQRLHAIVCSLMYAENFFIVRYDGERAELRFLYFADTEDLASPPIDEGTSAERWRGTLTWYVLQLGRPLMGTLDQLAAQVDGPLQPVGPDCSDWLGVPMLRDGVVHGALVVQSYRPGLGYTQDDCALLNFVASHILTALERRQSKDELEQRVALRTQELAAANLDLQQQVAERQRAERLQAALFHMAQLATAAIDEQAFYRQVHAIVGELINAENFYIALVDEAARTLHFPYAVDINGAAFPSRPLGQGLSEFVLANGPLVQDRQGIDAMYRSRGFSSVRHGPQAVCWLGVPLHDGTRAIGLVAVQSYSEEVSYGLAEQELLVFVASQISNSLQRRRAADALQHAYAQLERRVHERTGELRREIGERERMQQQLRHQIMHDPLTGLANRDHFRDRIESSLAAVAAAGTGEDVALLYLDIDRFKIINDSLGHLAGDTVLKEVARRLPQCVRPQDLVGRLSGDEFALLLRGGVGAELSAAVAQRVLDALGQPMPVAGRELQLSASIGIVLANARHRDADELLRDGDMALYRAKALGRNRYERFDESLARSAVDELALEAELRQAIVNNEFEPYLQPICRLDTGERVGYEALIRWNHPRHGVLPPDQFLQVAQEAGQIEVIDWRLFETACERLLLLPDELTFLTLNVSALHLRHVDFDQRLLTMLRRTGLAPSRLIIEVTEGSLLDDPAQVRATLERLRQAGVGAALDDFGTGYSSLSYLHSLPLKLLKIDRAFVHALQDEDRNSTTVVSAILALARALDIQVIAEGIETELQRRALGALGCELAQGYLLHRPAPIGHWLAQADAAQVS